MSEQDSELNNPYNHATSDRNNANQDPLTETSLRLHEQMCVSKEVNKEVKSEEDAQELDFTKGSPSKRPHFAEKQERVRNEEDPETNPFINEEDSKVSPSKVNNKKNKAVKKSPSKLGIKVKDLEGEMEQQKKMMSLVSDFQAVILEAKGNATKEDGSLLVQRAFKNENAFLAAIISVVRCMMENGIVGEYTREEKQQLSKELFSTELQVGQQKLNELEKKIEHLSQELHTMKLGAELAIDQSVTAFNSQETIETKMEIENLEKNKSREHQRGGKSDMRGPYLRKKVKPGPYFLHAEN